MKFWTIMIILYGGGGDDLSAIMYPSQETCGAAIEPVFATLKDHFPELSIVCRETDKPSNGDLADD